MPTQTPLGMNPMLALLPPDQQQNLMQLQQQQAIGQALLQQGLQPIDTSSRQVGGMGYRISPLEGLAKMANMYIGNKLARDSMGQQAQIMGQMYGNAFGQDSQAPIAQPAPPVIGADSGALTGPTAGMGGAQGTPSPQALGATLAANGIATPTQTVTSPGTFSIPGMTAAQSKQLYMMNPEEYAKARMAFLAPTDATRMALAAHMDPTAANAGALLKANNLPFNTYAPNTILQDPRTGQMSATPSAAPEGSYTVLTPNGPQVVQTPGAAAAIQSAAAARTGGEGSQLPFTEGKDAAGNPLPVMSRTQAATGQLPLPLRNNNPGAVSPGGSVAKYPDMQSGIAAMDQNLQSYAGKPGTDTLAGVLTKWVGSAPNAPAYISDVSKRLSIAPNQKVDLTNPAQRLAISSAIMLHENGAAAVFAGGQGAAPQGNGAVYAAAPMGAQAGATSNATNLQNEMSKKWTDLNAANQQAQITTSYLQSIKSLAGKANLGQMGDKLAYANSLLALAGSPQAQDAVTANNLLDKYQNQIISRLGQGGMGTDSARSILESAYPGRKMDQAAINEASDNLAGVNSLVQAKARLLAPIRNAGDAQGYTNTETKFDQAADPRIWQLQNMAPPDQAKYVAGLAPAAAKMLLQNRQVLKSMGALQ